MPIDYEGLAAVATKLITENGRPVTVKRDPTAPEDPANPWGANATSGAGAVEVETLGVFLEPGEGLRVATSLSEHRRRVLLPPDEQLAGLGVDFYLIDDDGRRFQFVDPVTTVRPGPRIMYYDAELRA